MSSFTVFQPRRHDLVLAADYNASGTRLALASADHKLQVFDVEDNDSWKQVDAWRAHNAEVLDVKWNGPAMGQVMGSIGEDNKFKLWQEDSSQAPNSGRRFRCIFAQSASHQLPYLSLDFKNTKSETHLALITRDGLLSLLEPSEIDSLGAWKEIDHFLVCGERPPARGAETSFKLSFHRAEFPCYAAVAAGLPRNALSLAVAAMHTVFVYRAIHQHNNESSNYRCYQAAELTGHGGLVRDVAWAPGSYRPHDWIASACDDGYVRVFELSTPHTADYSFLSLHANLYPNGAQRIQGPSKPSGTRGGVSGIGAGLASASSRTAATSGSEDGHGGGHVRHEWKLIAEVRHDGVWNIRWTPEGNMLISAGDDGQARMWRPAMDGQWLEFAEFGPDSD